MAIDTELITSQEVVDLAIVGGSLDFDEAQIENQIIVAQRQYIRDVLGEDYYNEFLDGSATADEDTLLLDKFIKPCLAYYTVYEALPFIKTQITDQGIMMNETEYSNDVGSSRYDYLRRDVLRKAEMWESELKRYIKKTREADSAAFEDQDDSKDTNSSKGPILY